MSRDPMPGELPPFLPQQVRQFDTGANRDVEDGKYDYMGFLDPAVLEQFAKYMNSHRTLPDGSVRDGSNWKKGMPLDSFMGSMLRHVFDLWLLHEGREVVRPETGKSVSYDDALGGIMFNVQGYWSQHLRGQRS